MLPKLHRFKGGKEIGLVKKDGESWKGEAFVAKYLKLEGSDSQFAVVVSTKISRKATVRNKIKRRVYEIIRLFIKSHPSLKTGYHCIFYVRSSIISIEFPILQTEMQRFLNSIT